MKATTLDSRLTTSQGRKKRGVKGLFRSPEWPHGRKGLRRTQISLSGNASFRMIIVCGSKDKKVKKIQKRINVRPRERLGFTTPKQRFFEDIS
jgi:hypothetical protein